MNLTDVSKTLSRIASEYNCNLKTLRSHIKKNERLRDEIKPGLQFLKQQKSIYETFGYPPEVDKNDYLNI